MSAEGVMRDDTWLHEPVEGGSLLIALLACMLILGAAVGWIVRGMFL